MHSQPDDVQRLLDEGWEPAKEAAAMIAGAERIFLTGIGTSYHAALAGSWLLRAAGYDARAVSSFDMAHYPEIDRRPTQRRGDPDGAHRPETHFHPTR